MHSKIGVFDSGIGGSTVLKECLKLCNNYEYIYYSDSKNNPYGDKNENEIKKISLNICDYLISKGCIIIIIACNTASAISLEYLRLKYKDIIFIAIEPAIKLAYLNKDGPTLIMATEATLNSKKFKELYTKYHDNNFYLLSCSGLADIIENNYNMLKDYLETNLKDYKNNVKSVVLGCTHYSLIKKEISGVLKNVKFYDGNVGVAKRLKTIIENNNIISEKSKITFIDSSNDLEKEKRFWYIINSKNDNII